MIEASSLKAKVKITQTTVETSGAKFQDNIGVSLQVIKKHNGAWKLYGIPKTLSFEPLNY